MLNDTPHIVIYSHGFGVRKNARGLFTDIARALPDAEHVMFDYNPINEKSNTLTVKPLNEQAMKLRKIINSVRTEYPQATLDLVCHSQGCIVAGMLKPRGIRKVILLTPPLQMEAESVASQLSERSGQTIETLARTRMKRSDGSTTVIHPEYWQSLAGIEPVKLFNKLSRVTQLRMIIAKQDDVIGSIDFTGIENSVSKVTLNGNHNFDDSSDRARLIHILKKELALDS